MPHWGWLVIGVVVVLVAVSAVVERRRSRNRPVDPTLVVRDAAEQRVDQKARRRADEVRPFDDPGFL